MEAISDCWLTRQELADRLKVPVATVSQWATRGKGPRFARIGKYSRYRLSDVVAWENSQGVGGSDAA
ncbi:helix-turn-helix transcriptional regulator [Nocardia flavorosea]|uniref:Helix-turn-helix domain-containing protein n=1 Tax=Nocardia flavorosea TaxID=53429 RepID=A0A846YHB2_9NOCA|nr:helix-turn-helix domain-containing protein [Nocardia flavorosea]NKY57221.1 helix-turn-helix domain-containing protein [Nocardia flavorosea]